MDTPTSSMSSNQELDNLPNELFWESQVLCQWERFWYDAPLLRGILGFQKQFKALSDDVVLASSMKAGTTWLKTLCFYIMAGQSQGIDSGEDALEVKNPHELVWSLEYSYTENPDRSDQQFPSRLFHTHLPYSALPDSIKNSECKIVYMARNPKDTLVSMWHFFNKVFLPNQAPYPFGKAYEAFTKGVHPCGPYLDHVLEYWLESLKMPNKILFLKYEEVKKDPKGQVKRLASFLGRPFVNEEEVDTVLWKSSLERLKNLEVNKSGAFSGLTMTIPKTSFFRLGVVGDWKNYFTPEMKQDLDEITRKKLEESGLHFET